MLRINRETDYATGILGLMAGGPQRRYSASWLAERRCLPVPVVSKILKQLARAGILESHRGAKGGYQLSRAAEEISIASVIQAMEGPIALTDCIGGGDSACQYSANCGVSDNWSRINRLFEEALRSVSLRDMIGPPPPMHTVTFPELVGRGK
jgi:FeS assembly SUF system regulator